MMHVASGRAGEVAGEGGDQAHAGAKVGASVKLSESAYLKTGIMPLTLQVEAVVSNVLPGHHGGHLSRTLPLMRKSRKGIPWAEHTQLPALPARVSMFA